MMGRDASSRSGAGATTRTGTIATDFGRLRSHRWTLIVETPSSIAITFCVAPAAARSAA